VKRCEALVLLPGAVASLAPLSYQMFRSEQRTQRGENAQAIER
jgi:hypothetical protein